MKTNGTKFRLIHRVFEYDLFEHEGLIHENYLNYQEQSDSLLGKLNASDEIEGKEKIELAIKIISYINHILFQSVYFGDDSNFLDSDIRINIKDAEVLFDILNELDVDEIYFCSKKFH